MSLPSGRSNIVGSLLDNVNDLKCALTSAFMTNNQTLSGVEFDLPQPESLFFLCTLVSGALTLNVSNFVAGVGPSFGSPTKTVTISGTVPTYIHLDATTNLGVALQLVAGASGCQIAELGVFSLNQLHQGQGWFDVTSGQNAVSSTITGQGDLPGPTFTLGSGVVSILPTSNNVFTP